MINNRLNFFLDNFLKLSLYAFGLFLLVPARYKSYLVIALGIISLALVFQQRRCKFPKIYFSAVLLFFVYVVSVFLSDDFTKGFKMLETKFSIFIFPIIFMMIPKRVLQSVFSIRKFTYVLFISNFVYSVILLIYFTQYTDPKYPDLYIAGFFRAAAISLPYLGEHPLYISYLFSFSILLLNYIIVIHKHTLTQKCLILVGLLPIFMVMAFHLPKSVLIGLTLALLFYNNRFIKRFWRYILPVLFTVGILFFVLVPKQNNRFAELLEMESYTQYNPLSSTSQRTFIYSCTLELLFQHPFFGIGIADVKPLITACYNSKTNAISAHQFNTHNQFFDIWLTSGVLGLFIFLYFIWSLINAPVSVREKSLWLAILILFCFTLLFENLLNRQTGLIFTFFMLFLLHKLFEDDSNNHVKSTA